MYLGFYLSFPATKKLREAGPRVADTNALPPQCGVGILPVF